MPQPLIYRRLVCPLLMAVALALTTDVATVNAKARVGVRSSDRVGDRVAHSVTPANQESARRGELIYPRCLACHALAYDRVGPHHCGLIGRRAGSVAGFAYSAAMKKSGIIWNEASLNRFLTRPLKMVPGSSMTYDGITDAGERADLIAYLKQAGQSAECKK